jgi:hypothetical protein
MQDSNAVAVGFMDWSADFNAMDIKDDDLSPRHSHTPWATVEVIMNK